MPEIERVVTRVRTAAGNMINVRNDELDAWVADNPGATIDGRAAAEVIAESVEEEQPVEEATEEAESEDEGDEAIEGGEGAPPRAMRATRSPRARTPRA